MANKGSILTQGQMDGACFLYSIANAVGALTGNLVHQAQWDRGITSLTRHQDFLASPGTYHFDPDSEALLALGRSFASSFTDSICVSKTTKIRSFAALRRLLTSETVVIASVDDGEHWVVIVDTSTRGSNVFVACSVKAHSGDTPYLEMTSTNYFRAHNDRRTFKDLNIWGRHNYVLTYKPLLVSYQKTRKKAITKHELASDIFCWMVGSGYTDLSYYEPPLYFLRFSTISFSSQTWSDVKSHQNIPFQFSIQHIPWTGRQYLYQFIDLSGDDPSRDFAQVLIDTCGDGGSIFPAGFESQIIKELAERFPDIAQPLLTIHERIVDMFKFSHIRFTQHVPKGCQIIEKHLSSVDDLDYQAIKSDEVTQRARRSYVKAIAPNASPSEIEKIRRQLLNDSEQETNAMVRMWKSCTSRQNADSCHEC